MSTTPSSAQHPIPQASAERALVLGGGGSTGNAWLIGVVAGLLDGGVDVTMPDLTVGTSAGSTAAAQLAGASPADLLAATLTAPPPPAQRPGPAGAGDGQGTVRPVLDHLDRMTRIIAASRDATDLRRRLAAAALEREAASDGTWSARWRAVVAARLPRQDWPARRVLLTALDALTGRSVVLDGTSGVDLVDAVAASCSSGLPYRTADRAYLDGGFRRNENADLAAGHARVLVLAPFGGATLTPPEWGLHLAAQVDELRAGGSRVLTVGPDAADEHLFGANAMDGTLRPAAARAGLDQGRRLADQVGDLWR